jgi:twitching motility protein PilT
MRYFDLPPIIERMLTVSDKISDLNFSVGQTPQVEINGKLTPVQPHGLQKLSPYQTEIIAMTLLRGNPDAAHRLAHTGATDLSYSLPSRMRFRVNIFQQRGTYSIVMRVIPTEIPTLQALHLPAQLSDIIELRNGIVIVTGPTGAGKSSTLAALIDLINEKHHYHIVTIEDPIEFLHSHKNSTINQREIGSDARDFPSALRSALRQAPKVILIGEMRDYETTEIALEAAETGHLVLSTLHTIDASKTVDRIIGVFPKNEEQAIRTRLAQSFRFIVSQRLVPRADGGGRAAIVEILKSTARTRDYMERGEQEGRSLLDAMDQGELEGMQTFDGVIEKMVRAGVLNRDEAMAYASNPGNLLLRLSDMGAPAAPQKPGGSMLDVIE